MFSQKTSLAAKSKTAAATTKKTTPSVNSSPSKNANSPNATETKPSTVADKNDHPRTNLANQLKDVSKVAVESTAADPNPGIDFNASELSIIKLLEGETDENKDKKLLEENSTLKKDLAMKNNLIERLMKENSDLRKEMDELLSTVENAKDKIDSKLKVCNDRIQELEHEIKHVKDENFSFSEEIQKLRKEQQLKKSSALPGFEEHINKYYHESQEQIESFYQHMTLKISEFMQTSKEKHDQLNSLINSRTEENKKEAPRPQGRASVPNHIPNQSQTHNKNRPSTSRLATYTSPTKSKTITGLAISQTPTSVDRVSSLSVSNRRKKNLTLHDLDDVNQANTSDHANNSTETKNAKKSPTNGGSSGTKSNFFTPKGKAKVSFKPTNICYTEGDKN